jgi:enoyl-CoA hydratase/carnithine racemase
MNTSEVILIEHDPSGILQLTLNRPAELNAWTYDLEAAFFAALDSAAADPSVRTVVITGRRPRVVRRSVDVVVGRSP